MTEDATQRLLDELAAMRREHAEERAELRKKLAAVEEKLTYREQVFVGWKQIADYLGYSEDHAKALGQDPIDPIPHVRNGGFVEAERSMLDRWTYRRRVPAQKRGAKGPGQVGAGEGPRRQLGLFEGPIEPKRGRAKDGSAS